MIGGIRSLWASAAGDLVAAARAAEQRAQWAEWCREWRLLHQFLNNRHFDGTHALAVELYPRASQHWAAGGGAGYRYMPFVKMVANTLAVAFARPPSTYLHRGDLKALPETDPQVQQWRQDEKAIGLHRKLQRIEQLVSVLGQCTVMPSWQSGRMKWQVFSPYETVVVPGDEDATELSTARCIRLEVRQPLTPTHPVTAKRFMYWTREDESWRYGLRDGGGGEIKSTLFDDDVNPYGRHPVVLWQFEEPDSGEIFVAPNQALLKLQQSTNLELTDMKYGLQFAAHPVWEQKGQTVEGDDQTLGPDVRLQFQDERGSITPKTPTLNTGIVQTNIEWTLQTYAVTEGFPPDTFAVNSSTRNLAAKQHEAQRLQIRRESVYPSAVRLLEETFDVHRTVANYWVQRGGVSRKMYADDIQLGVQLLPIEPVTDRLQGAQADQLEQDADLTTTVEREMRATGVSRVEAEARVRQRREENAANGG